ncbi:MAG: hypothetical protein ACRDSG_17705 [Pseudonocardiaceae bacterium]
MSAGLDQLVLPNIPPELLPPGPAAPALPAPQQPSAGTRHYLRSDGAS